MTELIYPDGFKPGCLPRKYRPGELFPMASERIELVPRNRWDELAAQVSLKPHVKTVLSQGNVGSCACEATAQAVMIVRSVAGLEHVVLAPWFIYRVTSGGSDQGSSIDTNLKFIQENGIAPMDLHPRSKGWRAKPTPEAEAAAARFKGIEVFDVATIDEMVSALLTGFACVFGSNGHAVTAVHHDGDYPLIVNSWSESWGSGGYGKWCSYGTIRWEYGAFALRTVSEGRA